MAPYLIKSSEAPKKTSGAPSAVTFTQAQTHNYGQTRNAGGCEYDQACRKPAVKGSRTSPVENPPKYLLKDSLKHAEKYLRVSLSYAEPTNWTGDQARGSLALPVDGSPKYLMRDSLTPTERTIWTSDQERGSLALSKEGPPKYLRDSLTHAEKTIWKTGELDQARGARGFHLEDPATKQQREDMARLERELRADELEHARGSRGFHVEDPVAKQQREAWARLERELREDNSQGLNPQAQEFRPPTPPLSPVQEPMRRHAQIPWGNRRPTTQKWHDCTYSQAYKEALFRGEVMPQLYGGCWVCDASLSYGLRGNQISQAMKGYVEVAGLTDRRLAIDGIVRAPAMADGDLKKHNNDFIKTMLHRHFDGKYSMDLIDMSLE